MLDIAVLDIEQSEWTAVPENVWHILAEKIRKTLEDVLEDVRMYRTVLGRCGTSKINIICIIVIPARGPQTKFSYIFCWYLLKPHVFCCSLGGRACQQVLRAKHLLTMSV